MKTKRSTAVIDLFAGVGGLSLGAIRAGFNLVLAVEWDLHALDAHKKNFPKLGHSNMDISTLSGDKLLEIAGLKKGELDGLIGGPPCQGFSVMGEQNTLDPRNDLFIKFFDLVREIQPRFFVAENVPGILNKKYNVIRQTALEKVLPNYSVLTVPLKASDFGAPTSRERVFFIGYLPEYIRSITLQDIEEMKTTEPVTVADALDGLPVYISTEWIDEVQSWQLIAQNKANSYLTQYIYDNIPAGIGDLQALQRYKDGYVSGFLATLHSDDVADRYKAIIPGKSDPVSRAYRLKLDGLCPTLRAGTGPDKGSYQAVRPIHPTEARVITPREAARLQGFPDWFQFSPTKWHSFRQIGNSVSPILAEKILTLLYNKLVNFSRESI